MLENLFILLLFLGALGYLGSIVWRSFFAKSSAGCAKGCASCAIDADKLMQMVEKE